MSATSLSFTESVGSQLDDLLYEICEELQLSPFRHMQAEQRYLSVGEALESDSSPFHKFAPAIYPQGSMRLGTTVKPISGPHDLDFVVELSRSHHEINPMGMLLELYRYLKEHGIYGPMTTLKNRCVRIEYANEFYMDILPACRNLDKGGTYVKVPDRRLQQWKDSNPVGYADWFEAACSSATSLAQIRAKAEPIPPQQAAGEKYPLKLAVQLFKRWRDIYYQDTPDTAPISIVITTLAAQHYAGNQSVAWALLTILRGIEQQVWEAKKNGHRIIVLNPKNLAEDLSERWSGDLAAYR